MVDVVALTALVISLVALFTTIGQLLQQYFATADGYRRCQRSVMGLWASKTRLQWRWREFRFETIFVVPRITYVPLGKTTGQPGHDDEHCALLQTEHTMSASMTMPGWENGWKDTSAQKFYSSDELACWVPLLAQLHKQGKYIAGASFLGNEDHFQYSASNLRRVPAIRCIHKSWDFMPPDIVRPMATSTVSDVAVMARRLGMVWKNFDPGHSLRAEGNGHVITSSVARSIGIIIQYTFTSPKNAEPCFYNPAIEADKLAFGVVTLHEGLFGTENLSIDISSYAGVARTLPLILGRRQRYNRTRAEKLFRCIFEAIEKGEDFIPGLNDILPLCLRMLVNNSVDAAWMCRVPSPNLYSRGVTSSYEGFQVFGKLLEMHVTAKGKQASDQSQTVLSCIVEINANYGGLWAPTDNLDSWQVEKRNKQVSFLLKDRHSQMTEFLHNSKVKYTQLFSEHILMAGIIKESHTSSDYEYDLSSDVIDIRHVKNMEAYFSALPDLVSRVLAQNRWLVNSSATTDKSIMQLSSEDIEDAWLSMMFRAFCWQGCHDLIPGVPPLPSEYWNSKMPVYIG